jgi:hypothetical protein
VRTGALGGMRERGSPSARFPRRKRTARCGWGVGRKTPIVFLPRVTEVARARTKFHFAANDRCPGGEPTSACRSFSTACARSQSRCSRRSAGPDTFSIVWWSRDAYGACEGWCRTRYAGIRRVRIVHCGAAWQTHDRGVKLTVPSTPLSNHRRTGRTRLMGGGTRAR